MRFDFAPQSENLPDKLVASLCNEGRVPAKWNIDLLELTPIHFVLLDGAHRICSWWIACQTNNIRLDAVEAKFPAHTIYPTLSFQQAEIIVGGLNRLPFKGPPDFMDHVCCCETPH